MKAHTERVCPVCGKKFVPAAFHVYEYNGQAICTYGCMMKAKRDDTKQHYKTIER